MSSEMVVIIRPSFMKICGHDGCRAAAFNHALYWIAQKAKDKPKEQIQSGDVTWYATTEEFTSGLANAWGVCKVRSEVNALISMGLIGRGKNPSWGADRTKHFFFGKEQCAKFLDICQEHKICLHHLGLHKEVLQMINLSNPSEEGAKCPCGQMINLSDAPIDLSEQTINLSVRSDKSIGPFTKDSPRVTSKVTNKGRENGTNFPEKQSIKGMNLLSFDQSLWFTNILMNSKIGSMVSEVNKQVKIYIEKLMPRLSSIEQVNNLYDFSEKRMLETSSIIDKTVYLGNLAKYLPAWLQAQERAASQSQDETSENPDGYSSSADAKQAMVNSLLTPSTGGIRSLRGGKRIFDKPEYVDTWGSSADAIEDTEYYSRGRRIVDGDAWPVRTEQVETG